MCVCTHTHTWKGKEKKEVHNSIEQNDKEIKKTLNGPKSNLGNQSGPNTS